MENHSQVPLLDGSRFGVHLATVGFGRDDIMDEFWPMSLARLHPLAWSDVGMNFSWFR